MGNSRNIAIIDIGKTNAKLVLVDAVNLEELEVRSIANKVLNGAPYPHYDTVKIWNFILDGLTDYQKSYDVSAISITSHGAAVALLDEHGKLAVPILDYEHSWPEELIKKYNDVRPPFSETGSPRLSVGLNIGAQLFYQFESIEGLQERTTKIVTYAQFWAYLLTGITACEVTSLGCHTDLWNPHNNKFSSLVSKCGWSDKFATVRSANEILGEVTPQLCKQTGLKQGTPVYCGIHDSNASLLPYLQSDDKSFSVVSTGTWVITMTVGGKEIELNEKQDTLINVNALCDKVPSARFMGGREYELLMDGIDTHYNEDDISSVLTKKIMILPAVEPLSGPFQNRKMAWRMNGNDICDSNKTSQLSDGERAVAASFYLALMTGVCLRITGANGVTFLEGPMSKNDAYQQLLTVCTGRDVVSSLGTGTSAGAAILCGVRAQGSPKVMTTRNEQILAGKNDALMQQYCTDWLGAIAG